jgi:hypothetical protein
VVNPLGFYWLAYMQIFRIFSKMLGDLPAPAISRALDAECRMLEDDFQNNRFDITEDVISILCFGAFVEMVKRGNFCAVQRICLRNMSSSTRKRLSD